MKQIFGLLLFLTGIAVAIYIGGYLMIYGGIVQIIAGATATPVVGSDIAWGIIKIVFCEVAGIFAIPFYVVGMAIMKS